MKESLNPNMNNLSELSTERELLLKEQKELQEFMSSIPSLSFPSDWKVSFNAPRKDFPVSFIINESVSVVLNYQEKRWNLLTLYSEPVEEENSMYDGRTSDNVDVNKDLITVIQKYL